MFSKEHAAGEIRFNIGYWYDEATDTPEWH